MRHVCTYFDKNFLPRGLALLDSLKKNSKDFKYYILALDIQTVEYFQNFDDANVQVISLKEYSQYFQIDKTKYENEKEFYFSLTPGLCLYVLEHYQIDILLYLDADVYLFNNLEILYTEIGNSSIALCSHRLPWYVSLMSKNYGIYNVGVNAFRNDEEGIKCLKEWYQDCTTWTQEQDGYPLSFFSDQIWLDSWPHKYKNVKIIQHKGINTAPWNAINYKFSKKDGNYYVDNILLVVYHFSSLKKLSKYKWHGNTSFTIHNISGVLLEVYKKYLQNVEKYEVLDTTKELSIEFEGSKMKKIVYNILKYFHNSIIDIEKE